MTHEPMVGHPNWGLHPLVEDVQPAPASRAHTTHARHHRSAGRPMAAGCARAGPGGAAAVSAESEHVRVSGIRATTRLSPCSQMRISTQSSRRLRTACFTSLGEGIGESIIGEMSLKRWNGLVSHGNWSLLRKTEQVKKQSEKSNPSDPVELRCRHLLRLIHRPFDAERHPL